MDIDPKDLSISTFSPESRGGWALYEPKGIKVIHIPTGLTVTHSGERTAHRNRAMALEKLKSALEDHLIQPLESIYADPLPDWAVAYNRAKKLTFGTQLCTKDGRKMGNATIFNVESPNYEDESIKLYSCISDAGNRFKMNAQEIHERFWIGDYIINLPLMNLD